MKPVRQLPISDRFMSLWESAARATEQGTPELADKLYDQAAAEHPEVCIGLADSFKKEGNMRDAIKWSLLAPKYAEKPRTKAACWNKVGAFFCDIFERDKATQCFMEGLKIDKRHPDLLSNLTLCLKWQGRLDDALKILGRLARNDPRNHQVHFSIAMLELLKGNLLDGFRNYESRFKNPVGRVERLKTDKPEWNGQSVQGKRLLVYCEQGTGDTIQMTRYAEWIISLGATPLLRCQKGLKPLLALSRFAEVVDESEQLPEFDLCVASMSLPHRHRTTLDSIPLGDRPYLRASCPWELPGKLKVGVSWAGSIDNSQDGLRSTDLSQWSEILAVPGVTFYSLQVGIRSMDLIGLDIPVVDLSPRIKSFLDTANAIAGLDLIISVDTSTVHLAGAMGKETWVMLPYCNDWRWLVGRDDSPWYKSLRLFRQPAFKEWAPVIRTVAELLRARVSRGNLRAEPGTDHPEAVPL